MGIFYHSSRRTKLKLKKRLWLKILMVSQLFVENVQFPHISAYDTNNLCVEFFSAICIFLKLSNSRCCPVESPSMCVLTVYTLLSDWTCNS